MMWNVSSSACLPHIFGEVSVQMPCSVFKLGCFFFFLFLGGLGLFVFLLSFIYSSFIYTGPLWYMWFANIFFRSVACLFIFLAVYFKRAEIDQYKYRWNLFYLFFPFVGLFFLKSLFHSSSQKFFLILPSSGNYSFRFCI